MKSTLALCLLSVLLTACATSATDSYVLQCQGAEQPTRLRVDYVVARDPSGRVNATGATTLLLCLTPEAFDAKDDQAALKATLREKYPRFASKEITGIVKLK